MLDHIYNLEADSYPADEAASREKLHMRLSQASSFFIVAHLQEKGKQEEELVGFACGTLAEGDTLTHESMAQHNPSATTLCIHSVVVAERFRGKGLATLMLGDFFLKRHLPTISSIGTGLPQVERVLLICKQSLIPLYQKCGFSLAGPSAVVHGKDPWYEMRYVM